MGQGDVWRVVAEPVGENPGLKPDAQKRLGRKAAKEADPVKDKANVGGIVIYLAKGGVKEEVTRVGFIRSTSENPRAKFKDKLDEMVEISRQACEVLNKLTPDGPLQ